MVIFFTEVTGRFIYTIISLKGEIQSLLKATNITAGGTLNFKEIVGPNVLKSEPTLL